MADLLSALDSMGWTYTQHQGLVEATKGDLCLSFTATKYGFGVWSEPAREFLGLAHCCSEVRQVLVSLTPSHAESLA